MAEKTKEKIKLQDIKGSELLNKIFRESILNKEESRTTKFFKSSELNIYNDAISTMLPEKYFSKYKELNNYDIAVSKEKNIVKISSLPEDIKRFKNLLLEFEEAYLYRKSNMVRGIILEDFVLLGQELIRRIYYTKLLNPNRIFVIDENIRLIIDVGESAIQQLGRAPSPPKVSFRKFNSSNGPNVSEIGIEILSSGAFPDWLDKDFLPLKQEGKIENSGFENVINAFFDTPRARLLAKMVSEDKIKPNSFPKYNRMMFDLELMRLGQATTPGTLKMLLNSYYHGASFVDHSTNVSEQVQIIYDEENWKPACELNKNIKLEEQIEKAVKILVDKYFKFKTDSSINRDHPRTARISFEDYIDESIIEQFFTPFLQELKKYCEKEKKVKLDEHIHKILPTLILSKESNCFDVVRKYIDIFSRLKYKELAITSEFIKHSAGLMQYFKDADEVNKIIKYAKSRKINIIDGRTIDMIATVNKTIEATAGAISSGQGCIKIGLLGLTYEQMIYFVREVKKGIELRYKRRQNQLLVFIGLVDESVITNKGVISKPLDVSMLFVDVMRRTGHDILLLDTMHKGEKNSRLVKPIDKNDNKTGHLSTSQLSEIIEKANKIKCDIWVAGSYTEDQVYHASLLPISKRPSLICLGGAERNFGGLRLDPNSSYNPITRNLEEKKLSKLIEHDSDIKFLLSRDNKLSRDDGHVTGTLKRKGEKSKAGNLIKLRTQYLKIRKLFFDTLAEEAKLNKITSTNIDNLYFNLETLFKNNTKILKKLLDFKQKFDKKRNEYVSEVANNMYDLFSQNWIN